MTNADEFQIHVKPKMKRGQKEQFIERFRLKMTEKKQVVEVSLIPQVSRIEEFATACTGTDTAKTGSEETVITAFKNCAGCSKAIAIVAFSETGNFCSAVCMTEHHEKQRNATEAEKQENIRQIIFCALITTILVVCGILLYRGLLAAIYID